MRKVSHNHRSFQGRVWWRLAIYLDTRTKCLWKIARVMKLFAVFMGGGQQSRWFGRFQERCTWIAVGCSQRTDSAELSWSSASRWRSPSCWLKETCLPALCSFLLFSSTVSSCSPEPPSRTDHQEISSLEADIKVRVKPHRRKDRIRLTEPGHTEGTELDMCSSYDTITWMSHDIGEITTRKRNR